MYWIFIKVSVKMYVVASVALKVIDHIRVAVVQCCEHKLSMIYVRIRALPDGNLCSYVATRLLLTYVRITYNK